MAHDPSFAEGPAADPAVERTPDPGRLTPPPVAPPDEAPALLDAVRETYERGLYLQAFRAAAPLGPLAGWPGVEGQLLAGRLAYQLGAPALAARLHLRARRRHPASGEAWLWAHRAAIGRLGPYAVGARLRAGGPAGT
ncbi:MAG TPA: hypothetical protein VFP50_06580, partial [Anaeromyxobacteraceae bacterium]|nr:hypothetical protein [Anaeromyxobacteraceae bacterium]